jgi:hypothetical protein
MPKRVDQNASPKGGDTKKHGDEGDVAPTGEHNRSQYRGANWSVIVSIIVPLVTALIGAGFGFYQTARVQQYQAQTTLIVEAIKTGVDNPSVAINNLLFLADAGLLDDRVAKAVRQGKFAILPGPSGASRGDWLVSVDSNLSHLHPLARSAVSAVLAELISFNSPIRLYEGFRSPTDQQALYVRGVAMHDSAFTGSNAWQSVRQYGLGVTFGVYRDGSWSWNYDGDDKAYWAQLSEICAKHGLERIGNDPAAYEVMGIKVEELKLGHYPAGGDEAWADHLRAEVAAWEGSPAAPPPP